ncbi:hypothetical protein C8D87_1011291 [Lentzea atacamensis]|uniref:Uncharacterized protein n=1 Tax=Lentzea atacamensis TaxID=531938 RepID=A0ABX9ELU6_9PSEU|nr:hypothetical protein [Lentzea atacamensis]RAS70990.1 hypothetical protein C8D87_1011291 [Lentzea atacamensis]
MACLHLEAYTALKDAARRAVAEVAARAAAMAAITKRAKAAIAYAAKNNPLPLLQAALKPRIAMKDLVSSAPNLPARKVSALAETSRTSTRRGRSSRRRW